MSVDKVKTTKIKKKEKKTPNTPPYSLIHTGSRKYKWKIVI